jgi:tetratricopeptide (TPR) repeat protein
LPEHTCSEGTYRVDCSTAERIRENRGGTNVWSIDGAAANSRERLFHALAATLTFPEYFGHNWDATYDCLTDLAGGDEQPAVVLITHGQQFLAGMSPEWKTAQRVFADTADFWQGRGRLFLVLLVSDTPLPEVDVLPPVCLKQVLSTVDAEQEITLADQRISTLNRAGQFEEALQIAQELVARFPDNPRAHFVLGGTFDFQDRELDAVLPYQRAWELGLSGDDVPRFYVQYGSTLRNVGQFDEAVRILREGRERFPENAAIQAFLALALFSAGRPADALATALAVLAANAGAVDLHGYERALREYTAVLQASEAAE